MALIAADAAVPVQRQPARRPVSRIVPAIPLRLSRRAPAVNAVSAAAAEQLPGDAVAETQQTQQTEQTAPGKEQSERQLEKHPEKQPEGQPEGQPEEQPVEQTVEQTVEQPEEQPQQQPQQQPFKQPQQQLQEQLQEQPQEQPVEQPPSVAPEMQTGNGQSEPASEALASSPANSLDDDAQPAAELQATTNDEPNHVHNAPPPADSHSKPLSNGVHRRELPPPFYPAAMSGTTTPLAGIRDSACYPVPSVDGPMGMGMGGGGGIQELSAQPATPVAYEHAAHAHAQSVPRIPPGFAPPDFTPSFFPGHAHHPSDPGAPWLYPPYSMPPPPEPMYANGSDFHSPPFTAGPTPYPEPYPAHFSPEDPRFTTNGVATSHSQSPSKSQLGEHLPPADRLEAQHPQPQQNGVAPRSEEMSESPFELASYLSTQFGSQEFADFVLQVRSTKYQYMSIPVHAIVVVRSPVIANALRRSIPPAHRSRDSRRLADVLTTNPFVTSESIQEAVKVLYGAPLLSIQAFLYGLAHYSSEMPHPQITKDARRRMNQLLSYIAAGRVLQIPSMQVRGVDIAKALLRWDTVEQALHYALFAARSTGRDGAEVHDPFATELLNSILDFIAYNFPVDFSLHKIAAELRDDPRLPNMADTRAPTHNVRLSKIRFGDTPADDDTQTSPVSRTLSSILLSLPVPLLDRVFNHRATANQIGWTGAARVLHDVVDERERRRQKAVQGQLQVDSTAPSTIMDNLYLEERVEHVGSSPLHPSGYLVTAHRANGHD